MERRENGMGAVLTKNWLVELGGVTKYAWLMALPLASVLCWRRSSGQQIVSTHKRWLWSLCR